MNSGGIQSQQIHLQSFPTPKAQKIVERRTKIFKGQGSGSSWTSGCTSRIVRKDANVSPE